MDNDKLLRQQLVNLLTLGEAHAKFDDAVNNFPAGLRGKVPPGAEHSPWQVVEHLRIAQSDILEFSRDANHQSPDWPKGYWPEQPDPPSAAAWEDSIRAFHRDRESLCGLINDASGDLFAKFPHGSGQTLLREALLAADHNAYHLGELVLLRRLLGAWSKS